MELLSQYVNLSPRTIEKLLLSIGILLFLTLIRFIAALIIKKRLTDDIMHAYHWRRAVLYTYTILVILLIGQIWIEGIGSLTTFLGLASAGVAVAMHDTIANIAGWFFIITRKPFKLGDRIQIGDTAGDVAEKYLIFYGALTPIVYTTVKDSGVLLTIRYLVNPRQRRSTEEQVWEAILDAFDSADDIDLAYPTTRFYTVS